MMLYPKWVYEALPWLYGLAAWVCWKGLLWPYALVPTGAFGLATVFVIIQRWYYRRQFDDEDDPGADV